MLTEKHFGVRTCLTSLKSGHRLRRHSTLLYATMVTDTVKVKLADDSGAASVMLPFKIKDLERKPCATHFSAKFRREEMSRSRRSAICVLCRGCAFLECRD